ncbi:hypothetical protein PIB30_069790 [Stylosanthes scabra]|uniref:Uncharacterized protein n=1 Tax=Stylosanthes scabra TaxID=79078 RepID=A0ABU6TQH2_9FABA|nr:hypothetical protein [Stylosanthes scabra]
MKLSARSEKHSMLLGGRALNHVRASFFSVMVKALHCMASEAFTRSILFSNASKWCFGSVVPSYGSISTGYRNFLGISSARMRGENGCLPFSLPGPCDHSGRFPRVILGFCCSAAVVCHRLSLANSLLSSGELFRSLDGFRGHCRFSGLPFQEFPQSCFQLVNGVVPLIDLFLRGR